MLKHSLTTVITSSAFHSGDLVWIFIDQWKVLDGRIAIIIRNVNNPNSFFNISVFTSIPPSIFSPLSESGWLWQQDKQGSPDVPFPAPPWGSRGSPRPYERCNPSSMFWVYPWVNHQPLKWLPPLGDGGVCMSPKANWSRWRSESKTIYRSAKKLQHKNRKNSTPF